MSRIHCVPARIHPWVRDAVQYESLERAFEEYGSPINIVSVEPFSENVQCFLRVAEQHEVRFSIFYAMKANRSRRFVEEALRLRLGVDTASLEELRLCLEMGADPSCLISTAPIKGEELRALSISLGVTPMVDNVEELNAFMSESRFESPRNIGIRVSGFTVGSRKLYSRFGFDITELAEVFDVVDRSGSLAVSGLQFHLDGYSIEERVAALDELLDLAQDRRSVGRPLQFVDIGGGFTVDYLEEGNEWDHYLETVAREVGRREPGSTFLGNGTYWSKQHPPVYYPFRPRYPKEKGLDALLRSTSSAGGTIAARLRRLSIELRIEPGRALLDQCGMTAARVGARKLDTLRNSLVVLEMNGSQLKSPSDDYAPDPIFTLAHHTEERSTGYLVGNCCMESDFILRRKLLIPSTLRQGDGVVFPNTAGYFMHLYAHPGHCVAMPRDIDVKEMVREERARHSPLSHTRSTVRDPIDSLWPDRSTPLLKIGEVPEETLQNVLSELHATRVPWTASYESYQSGGWYAASLLNSSGVADDGKVQYGTPRPTPLLEVMPELRAFIESLEVDIWMARLTRLDPGGYLHPHRDVHYAPVEEQQRVEALYPMLDLHYPGAESEWLIRMHIPLTTHPNAVLGLPGEVCHLGAGEVWCFRPGEVVHGVWYSRDGELCTPRIHLLLDVCRSEKVDRMLSQGSFPAAARRHLPELDAPSRTALIARARTMLEKGDVEDSEELLLLSFYLYGLGEPLSLLTELYRGVSGWDERRAYWSERWEELHGI